MPPVKRLYEHPNEDSALKQPKDDGNEPDRLLEPTLNVFMLDMQPIE